MPFSPSSANILRERERRRNIVAKSLSLMDPWFFPHYLQEKGSITLSYGWIYLRSGFLYFSFLLMEQMARNI